VVVDVVVLVVVANMSEKHIGTIGAVNKSSREPGSLDPASLCSNAAQHQRAKKTPPHAGSQTPARDSFVKTLAITWNRMYRLTIYHYGSDHADL